jgi:hypothetical protein
LPAQPASGKKGSNLLFLKKQAQVAHAWRHHYDRLHLHTNKKNSSLPFQPFDKELPTYPARKDVVQYLETYAGKMDIHPVFNCEVVAVQKEGSYWITKTNNETYRSAYVIVAAGSANKPTMPSFNGLNSFKGAIMHSSQYKNGSPFTGKKVLVVGFGNSGCEQAICLHEHGAFPALSVRSAVNVLPRDVFGISILQLGISMRKLPPKLVDTINAPLMRLLIGDINKLGLRKSRYGPLEQIEKQKRIPLLDIGTVKLIKQGHIKVFCDIERIEGNTVYFENNRQDNFDAIILATGYSNNLESFIVTSPDRFEDLKNGIHHQKYFGKDGLYFCGYYISPNGMLREMGIEAKEIAKDIAAKNTVPSA